MKLDFSMKTLALSVAMSVGALVPATADDTPLGEEMDNISLAYKKLRKAETTADKVALVKKAQEGTIKSLAYMPMIFKDIKDEGEKAKASADYKRLMGLSYVAWCELELAFLAEDEDKVDAAKAKLKELKKEGHRKYTED